MSVEIYGTNPHNIRLIDAVGTNVAEILIATGVEPSIAHTTGELSARYAAALLLSSLKSAGEVSQGNVSDDGFIQFLDDVKRVTLDPSLAEELFEGEA